MGDSDTEVELTKGAMKFLMIGEHMYEPVVQVLGFCYCQYMNSGPIYKFTRRCVRLSDGENYAHAFLDSKWLENERNPPELEDHWIIKLVDFNIRNVVLGKRILLIHEALVLQDSSVPHCIGNPVNLDPEPSLKYFPEEEQDFFLAKVDRICDFQEMARARLVPSIQDIMNIKDVPTTENQRKHIKEGRESLEDSIAYFKSQYNSDELITPYMALSIEDGRNYVTAGTIEKCFEGKPIEEPRYIQVVDFRLTTDTKNEEYIHLLVNDSIQMSTAILCPFHLNSIYGREHRLKKFCFIQVQKYSCMTITKFRKCIVFHDIGDVKESSCVIRLTREYPEYCEDCQFSNSEENDPLIQVTTNFCELMEREGKAAYGERSEKRSEPVKPFKVKKTKQPPNNLHLPPPEKVISVGAVEKLAHAQDVKSPILQILLFKKIINHGETRYSLLLSDGYDIMTAMVDPVLLKETPKASFQQYTVLQILKYSFLKILRNRNTLMMHKIGYHIPVTADTKKAIGKPVYYTFDIVHPPDELRKIPRVTPYKTAEMVAAQRRQKRLRQMKMQFAPVLHKDKVAGAMVQAPPDPQDQSPLSQDSSADLSPIFSANTRVAPLEGFALHADRWHRRNPAQSFLPDGRVIDAPPTAMRIPYRMGANPEMMVTTTKKVLGGTRLIMKR